MTKKPTYHRRKKGFESTSALLTSRIRKAGETRGFAVTRVLTHWSEVVGDAVAHIARPVDISYGRGGMGATLTVLTTGAQAPMLEMQKETIRAKVNSTYGYNAIARIRLTQTAPTGFSEGKAQFSAAPKRERKPDPMVTKRAQEYAAPVGDDGLRVALEMLAQNIMMKQQNKEANSQ